MDTCNIVSAFGVHFHKLAKKFQDDGNELKPHQIECINNVLTKGNTLCIMPTGGGKSLVYWLSGMMLDGITVVVIPLVALIDEQEEKLRNEGIEVLALHSGLIPEKQVKRLTQFANGEITPKFIFVSPEKLATDGFFEYCIKIRKGEIKLITIDEVHCVSQWGASFRPDYRKIPEFIQKIFGENHPKILAMTATLAPKELGDICDEFWIEKPNILKDQSLMRSEIDLKIIEVAIEDEKDGKDGKLWNFLKFHADDKVLVYVYCKQGDRGVEGLSQRANTQHGIKSAHFHGDMSSVERGKIISQLRDNKVNVVFATSAFGMGIDIPDVRVVIHFTIPESIEQYYQEIGRAARDKKAANAYMLYSKKNISVKRKDFINASFPTRDKLIEVYQKIPKTENELQTLTYFEDEDTKLCLHYYVNCGVIQIVAKGFSSLNALTNIKSTKLSEIVGSTNSKNLITSAKKSGVSVPEIIEMVYGSLIKGEVETTKPLDRRLIISVRNNELSEKQLDEIMADIEQKKKYKRDQLDYLVFQIENTKSSIELHQEIARYLGVDRNILNKIYSTSKGDKVRSKSEVIIANLLFQHGIEYKYEEPLDCGNGKTMLPDFTILLSDGKKLFWEHLGMLGVESYDRRWLDKLKMYQEYFPGQLIKTYEGATISDSALDVIKRLKMM